MIAFEICCNQGQGWNCNNHIQFGINFPLCFVSYKSRTRSETLATAWYQDIYNSTKYAEQAIKAPKTAKWHTVIGCQIFRGSRAPSCSNHHRLLAYKECFLVQACCVNQTCQSLLAVEVQAHTLPAWDSLILNSSRYPGRFSSTRSAGRSIDYSRVALQYYIQKDTSEYEPETRSRTSTLWYKFTSIWSSNLKYFLCKIPGLCITTNKYWQAHCMFHPPPNYFSPSF